MTFKSFLPDAPELEQINRFTLREHTAQELFTFSVILCDNDIDRDFERFDEQTLRRMAEMYVGKTGLFDHDAKGENQTARIYRTELIHPGEQNALGEELVQLKAWAYLVRSAKNADLIADIEAGIKKEVSVGCQIAQILCSVCGADCRNGSCEHQPGVGYDGMVCHRILSGVTDVYEWSFVAVPAQRRAGVVKSYGVHSQEAPQEILKRAAAGEAVSLSPGAGMALAQKFSELEKLAEEGRAYREELHRQILTQAALTDFSMPARSVEKMAAALSIGELKELSKALTARRPVGQLFGKHARTPDAEENRSFSL